MNISIEQDYRLAARRGQLEPHFQPIVDLKDGRFKALEARARWHLGTRTLGAREVMERAPSATERFELDFVILDVALATFSDAPGGMLDGLQLAINLSPQTLLDAGFNDRIENALTNAGVPPNRLHIEIPLVAFESDVNRAHAQARALAEKGFTLAVDHVSDLDTVRTLLVDGSVSVVKLEEALVMSLPADQQARDTVAAIVALCHENRLLVGAEGVSRIDQLKWLQGGGCDEAQGMMICRPSPMNGLRGLLERGRCW